MKNLSFGQSLDQLVCPSLLLLALRMAVFQWDWKQVGCGVGLQFIHTLVPNWQSSFVLLNYSLSSLHSFFSIGVASSLFLWVVLHGSLPLAFSTSSVEDISSFEFLSLEFWWARTLACEVSAVAGHSPRRFWIWRIFFMSDFFIFCIYNSRFCLYHPGLAFILFYFTSRLVFF
ncbi:unnamed protein product, partial [Brassica napus]